MGSKRDNDAISQSEHEVQPMQPSKKARKQSRNKQEPKGDVVYGQRCVFPGLNNPTALVDDDLEWEDEGDALEYLRSVRTEAIGIPCLLVAPKSGPQLPPEYSNTGGPDRSVYENGIDDARGYYQDGAYTAVPDVPSSSFSSDYDSEHNGNGESTDRLRAEAFYKSLIKQFMALRARLHQNPPSSAVAALPPRHEVTVGGFGRGSGTFLLWQTRVRETDPLPVQVAAMDRDSAMRLLRVILGAKFLRRGYELRERTSRWIWSLLARLPDRGEMNHAEVGWIRALGKRAVLMLVSLAHMSALQEELDGDLDGDLDDDESLDGVEDGDEDDDEDEDEDECEHQCGNGAPETTESSVRDDDKPEQTGENAQPETSAPAPNDMVASEANDDGINNNSKMDMDLEDGEVSDASHNNNNNNNSEMEMDMDLEDGEVFDAPSEAKEMSADVAAAKQRLLSRLPEAQSYDGSSPAEKGKRRAVDDDCNDADPQQFDEQRARLNMRVTLNMILTVAGELYGQRDLLEFRTFDL